MLHAYHATGWRDGSGNVRVVDRLDAESLHDKDPQQNTQSGTLIYNSQQQHRLRIDLSDRKIA